MKKLISLLLMCWLPLFMSSAWAMDMQMQSAMPVHQDSSVQLASPVADMPCHMEAEKVSDSMQATADVGCANCLDNSTDAHDCASCGLCMISLTATQIESLAASFNIAPSNAVSLTDLAFFSQDYPPALKPPIPS